MIASDAPVVADASEESGARPREPQGADPREIFRGIESLIDSLGRVADPRARADAQALVRAVLELHAAGLAKILEIVDATAPSTAGAGTSPIAALVEDDLVTSLLLLHDLHPVSLEGRVRAALARAQPTGWTAELLDARGAVLRIGLARERGPRRIASVDDVRAMVEQAVDRAAPDAEGLEFTGDLGDADLVPVERLRIPGPLPRSEPR